jgi:hypothetical protein
MNDEFRKSIDTIEALVKLPAGLIFPGVLDLLE